DVLSEADQLTDRGDFKGAALLLDNALHAPGLSPARSRQLAFDRDVLDRIKKDYSLTKEDLLKKVTASVKDLQPQEFERWLADGWFDGRLIDGQMFYLNISISNLYFRHPELNPRRLDGKDQTANERNHFAVSRAIKEAALSQGVPFVLPHQFSCTMTVLVKSNTVPPGDIIRAWLPIPRQTRFQDAFQLEGAHPDPKLIAPETSPIRSAYFEQRAAADGSAKFEIAYTYTTHGVFFNLDPTKITPPNLSDPALAPFVKEAPHVVFTEKIRALASQLAGNQPNPMLKAKAFFDWIGSNVKYSFAREYSTLTNISDYCLSHRYGDCGQEALLFITLCRSQGIPARWQTGWDTFPGAKDIHDWTEIYLAPYGWVPVDPWAGIFATQYCPALTPAERHELHDFYFGGLDYYRMVANGDHSQRLDPPKATLRSDDVDFQRGELEWSGGNIYFDRYSFHLDVQELK
ncbi:MAG TPA: transglutaminase-like domain-containing protein, partial [Verrucomicrobiae bacterium]|nr:transglutaminase-like domain-containing protein [Verrucomicrobiae bacterium]